MGYKSRLKGNPKLSGNVLSLLIGYSYGVYSLKAKENWDKGS